MSKADSFMLILGDQLFPLGKIPVQKSVPIFMAEDKNLCSHFKYHKIKISFFLASMREYRDELIKQGFEVIYYDLDHPLFSESFEVKLDDFLKKYKSTKIMHHYRVSDHFFEQKIVNWCNSHRLNSVEYASPMFLTNQKQFRDYLNSNKKPFMMNFYSGQRQRLNIMMKKGGKPEGDKWSFDKENRKKYPKGIEIPSIPTFSKSKNTIKICADVEKYFSDHPGSVDSFWLPVNRDEALSWLNHFIEEKFESFGPYEDAIKSDDTFGFHSVISPFLNNGLLTPEEVIDKILKEGKRSKIPLASIEGFIRQVIGWREFVKGIYDNFNDRMETENFWGHHRKMGSSWYTGETGIPPFDDSVKRLQKYGYSHHIERLMIQSNLMLLSEIDPRLVHQWFMEMFVDSADWVMAANVYGMGQMSEGGIFSTKPYICGSNYIIKMSDYKKDEWCETLDGLYWRFIDKNKSFFKTNPRMSMMVRMSEKIPLERRKVIFRKAEEFLETHTS